VAVRTPQQWGAVMDEGIRGSAPLAGAVRTARQTRCGTRRGHGPAHAAAGFTFIELVISVLIVAILAAIALPAYRQYVIRGNRSAAEQVLLDASQREQQYLLDYRGYTDLTTLGVVIPQTATKYYSFSASYNNPDPTTCTTACAPTFTITATPVAGMGQTSDGSLAIDQAGNKTPTTKW
jgi:type IV pilus assembly protein PilE